MSRGVVRLGDFHFGHFCLGTGTGFHATPFVIPGSTSVIVNGRAVCTMGSTTACGDKIVTGNTSVLVGGKPIARMADLTSGHACTEAIETETTVPATGGGTVTVKTTDLTCKNDGGYFHPSACATGSGNVFA